MKKLHLTCDEYINYDKKHELHNISYSNLSLFKSLEEFPNLIIYGPNGVGKYTQSLQIIKKFSNTQLKYERKMSFEFNKDIFYFTLSDIHLEVDFDMLGCQSKLLWHEIYNKYIDILISRPNKRGIIICKNFQNIHSEMHEIFISYMNNYNINNVYNIRYILLTNSVSFIDNNIIRNCSILSIHRPSKVAYQKITKEKILSNNVYNIHNLKINKFDSEPHIKLCDELIEYLLKKEEFNIYKLRDYLYNLLIYNLDIYNCIWYINKRLSEYESIRNNLNKIIMKIISFLKLYNNNYRPIYHLESYFIFVFNTLHNIELLNNNIEKTK
tara:strand:+ start:6993 stop:7970 length:978 start_codon:yes stop_codon:yes gene_type:complete